VVTLHAARTDTVARSVLQEFRALLDSAFEGDFTDEDWAHTTGGVHVWLRGSGGVISHASIVERRLECSGQPLRVGYVEAVATAAAHRRQGHGASIMRHIGELIRERYVLGALSTGAHAFYEAFGWERWRGPTFVDSPRGRERTPEDDGTIMILQTRRSPRLDLDGDIACDWRPGDAW
jgi:aminoglycoside 2'-N-acetyltransferase I